MKKTCKFIAALFLFITPIFAAQAQSISSVQKLIRAEQFSRAKSRLLTLTKSGDRYDRATAYKLLGICYFELGDKRRAIGSYRRALRLIPDLGISNRDTNSRAAASLFQKVKRSSSENNPNRFRGARRRLNQSKPGSDPGLMIAVPFGTPQFIQGKSTLGSIFAATQVFGFLFYYERGQAAQTLEKQKAEVTFEQDSTGSYSAEDFDIYISGVDGDISEARQFSTLSLYLFLGSYIGGIAEAILYPPRPLRQARRRRVAYENARKNLSPAEEVESIYLSPQVAGTKTWDAKLLPSPRGVNALVEWQMKF